MKQAIFARVKLAGRRAAALAVAALLSGSVAFAAPPANDNCAGAIAIPDGPFPIVTAPVNVAEATPQGSDDPVFACAQTDATIWYSFTPTISANYIFSTCTGNGATGSTVYDSVLALLDSTGGACPSAASLACNDTDTTCTAALPGAPYVDQGTVSFALTGGHTYFVVAGHWSGDVGGLSPGFDQLAVRVDLVPAPANDTCSAPVPLQLDRVTKGTTVGANDDYRSPSTTACFSGIGQTVTSSPGRDVVFSFTAPSAGSYSVRYVQDDSAAALRSQNPVLYAASSCPSPGTVSCLKGANRSLVNSMASPNRSEEIDCLSMTAGQTVYVFFDDGAPGNAGGPLAIEVHACNAETESNNTPATANPYGACYRTGATNPTGDVDFFELGTPPAGSKVFAAIDALTTNNVDYELRVTTATDTLQYDDNDGTLQIGANAPVIAGTPATGAQTFIRVNHRPTGSPSEPYHLYARVETGAPQPEVDTPGNDTPQTSNLITGGGFVSGVLANATDQDCFRFVAHEGDDITMFSDNNPSRVAGTILDTWPVLNDLLGGPPMNTAFGGQVLRNNLTPSPGTLTGTTPSVTSEFWDYRARYTGTYFVCFAPISVPSGPPRPYQGSISLNCGAIPAPASHVTDVSVTLTGPAGPVNTGGFTDYTITLTNTGTDVAQDIRLVDTLPSQLVFLGLTKNDGFAGQNVGCGSLPAPGTAGATIDCTNFSLTPGASTTVTIHVQVANCSETGAVVHDAVSITTASTDPNPANDAASADFTTSTDGTCADIACNGTGCVPNVCTTGNHCDGVVCAGTPIDCDDGNACTDDACAPATGACSHAPDDSNTCSDGDQCTALDACHAGACVGDDFDCNVFCPVGFYPVGGMCQKTYDIDASLLDNLAGWCDGTGDNRYPGQPNDNLCLGGNYGFHWADLGGSLPGVASVSVQLEAGARTGNGPSSFTLNGVPAGSFTNDVGQSLCATAHQTISSPIDPGIYASGALNTISITPAFGGFCEGLSRAANLAGNFARVTVRYLPPSQPAGVCTAGTCDPGTGTCSFANLPDGTSCGGGALCTQPGTCEAGVCVGAIPVTCDAPPPCHTAVGATCDAGTGSCIYPVLANGSACSDGNVCTAGDTCQSGTCAPGTATVCAASDQCHIAGTCDPGTGTCSNPNSTNGTACNDGNACTPTDTCQTGVCTGSNAVTCTALDSCHGVGTCNPGTGMCSNPNAADGTTCGGGDLCTQSGTCQAGACTGIHPVTCTAIDACHVAGTCNPNTGTCSNPIAAPGTMCSDENACTAGDTCQTGPDLWFPHGPIQGQDGMLYGTAESGPITSSGGVFKLNSNGSGFTILKRLNGSSDGSGLTAGLIQGSDGAFYSTAQFGGSGGYGTVFKLNGDGSGFTVLKNFDLDNTGGWLLGGLMQGTDGALYGTAAQGGTGGYGTVFKLNADGSGFTVLKNFDLANTGGWLFAGLMQGADGALYGTASQGGSGGHGTLFKLNTDGTGFTVLTNFDGSNSGGNPQARLIQGTNGTLYGTAVEGGIGAGGTVFSLHSDGTGFTVLKHLDGTTGGSPVGGLMQGSDGALYGTNAGSGSGGWGTVFKLNPDGTGFAVLKNFDLENTGGNLQSALIQGADGALYSTSRAGGSNSNAGTVFKLNKDGTGFTLLKIFGADPISACATGSGTVDCDDHNPCTDDSCSPASGCVHANNTASCNDGSACTQSDTCVSGVCVGSNPATCAAPDQCHTAGVCNPSTGLCSNPAKPDGSTCSDGNSCTQTDTCVGGACTGGNFSWSGVLQPVNSDNSSVFKLGSTIPVKFKLTGACAGNPSLVANIYFYKLSNAEGPVNEATSTSAADTGTVFRYSAGDQYIFNLGTKGLSEGTWSLGIDLHDGVGIRVVTVGLRK